MPPPPPSNYVRMPSNSNNRTTVNSPMLCPSPTGYAISQATQDSNFAAVPQLNSSGLYQVKSPSLSSTTTVSSASKNQIGVVVGVGGAQLPMAPATINIPQPTQPVPTTLSSASAVTSPAMTSNSPAPSVQQVPVMQIIQTQSPTGVTRHQPMIMKPIQPKPQQILPKPVGVTNQITYSSGGKPVTLTAQRTPSTVNLSTTAHQTNSPLVIGQGQTILNNSGMVGHPQGTLLLNHILGMGQNPFIIPSGTGLPSNVQLVMRSQPTSAGAVPASQPSASLPTASAVNNALLAAFHAQTQAATQQAYMNQNKTLAGQGQTVVMQTGQTLRAATPPQLSNATLRPNLLSGTHVVSQGQPPLVLQQIQGPITVIQALQGANVGVGSTGITLANPNSAAGISQLGGILQGAVASSLPQSIMLNNQPVITSSVASLINPMGETVSVNVGHLQNHQPQQQQQTQIVQSQQPPPSQPRAQSVNLEELLKQAGIMPDDAPPSPQPNLSSDISQVQVEAQQQQQPMLTFTHLPTMSSDCISMMNGPQTVVMGQDQFQANHSALLAHLQQPMVSSQLSSNGSVQTQVKLSVAQDGSVIIRPVLTQGPALTLGPPPGQQNLQPQQVTFSMANINVSSCSSTTTTASIANSIHPLQSGVFQSVDGASHLQTQNTAAQLQSAAVQQQQQQLAAAAAASAAASIIPLSLQGINLNLVSGLSPASTYVPTSISGAVSYSTTPNQQQQQQSPLLKQQVASRCGTPVSSNQGSVNVTGPNSVLSQNHPKLVQTLGNEATNMTSATPISSNSSLALTIGSNNNNGNKVILQQQQPNPILLQSIDGITSTTSCTTTLAHPLSSDLASSSCATTSITSAVAQQSVKPPTVLVTGCPVTHLKPGQRIQTVQLSTQGQEALQRVNQQLHAALARKPRTSQDLQHIHFLQSEQQKIISQGKVISVQTQPVAPQFTRPPVPQSIEQSRGLQPKVSSNNQMQATSTVIVSSAHCTSAKPPQNGNNLRATPVRNAATFQSSNSSSTVLQATQTTPVISSQPPSHIKIGNQIFTLAPVQQQQTAIIGPQIQQQQQPSLGQNDNNNSNLPNVNFTSGVAQIQQLNRGVKRPASTPASRSSLIHQRLATDHNAVLCADYKTPFQSKEDAFRRLLPYHVLVGRTMSSQDLQKADDVFSNFSEHLIDRAHLLFNKYRYLLLKESMKMNSVAEEVMLERLFMQGEKEFFEMEKSTVEKGKELDPSFSPYQWKEPVIKLEPGIKTECDVMDVDNLNGGTACINQALDEEASAREKKKNYDEWAEIQKELENFPMVNDDISGSTVPVEFEPPSGSTSPVVDFEPPFPKIPKSEISFKESCQVNHIQRSHLDSYENSPYYQSHGHTLRTEPSQWSGDPNRRISHSSNNKSNEDENAVMGLDDITSLGVDQDVNSVTRLNHHHQGHDDGDSNDITGLLAAAAAAGEENNHSASVDDDSQDDELSAQVQSAINSILNLQRIDDSCDAFALPIDDYSGVSGIGSGEMAASVQNSVSDNQLLVENDDGGGEGVKNKCSYFNFKREVEDDGAEDEDESEVDQQQQVLSYESNNSAAVAVPGSVVGMQRHDMVSYSMEGPTDIDLALDEAVKSILL